MSYTNQKNEAAVNLVAQTSNLIGVIVTNATTSFAAPIIDSIEDWAYQNGGRILLAHCGLNDSERLKTCLNLMAGVKSTVSFQFRFNLMRQSETT
jgi:Transcriptional regulators